MSSAWTATLGEMEYGTAWIDDSDGRYDVSRAGESEVASRTVSSSDRRASVVAKGRREGGSRVGTGEEEVMRARGGGTLARGHRPARTDVETSIQEGDRAVEEMLRCVCEREFLF